MTPLWSILFIYTCPICENYKPVIPALKKLKQEDYKLKVSEQPDRHTDTLSQKEKQTPK